MFNNKRNIALAVVLFLCFTGRAMGQTRVLGLFQLDKATYEQVKAKLPKGVKILHDRGTPGDYGGPGIRTDGKGYNIDGLKGVSFGFDQNQTLAVVFLRLEDRRFNDIKMILSSKYRRVRLKNPEAPLLFKANQYYVYLYYPRDKDFVVEYMTGAVYRQEQAAVSQTVEEKKADEREEQKRLEREAAEEAAKF